MEIRLLGGPTGGNGSPRLWATDRDSVIVQGWRTGQDDRIEVPHQLLGYMELGTCLGAELRNTGRGTFVLTGRPMIDPDVLSVMAIPGHETAIEVETVKVSYPHALSAKVR